MSRQILYNDEYHIKRRAYNKSKYKPSTRPKIKYDDEKHRKQREYHKAYNRRVLGVATTPYPTPGYEDVRSRWYQFLCTIIQVRLDKLII